MSTKEYFVKWCAENRDKMRAYSKKHYASHKKELRIKHAEHYANNIDDYKKRLKRNHLKMKYGITVEFFDKLLIEQNGKCKICEVEFNEKHKACVDHCHKTNKVRGLLCRPCNLSLSVVENKDFLHKAYKYLQTSDV